MVYVVTPDKKLVMGVTYIIGEDAWEIATDGRAPFFSLTAHRNGKTMEYQLDPVGTMKRLLEEARGSQLWKGIPDIDA